jgi:hypothetical protein
MSAKGSTIDDIEYDDEYDDLTGIIASKMKIPDYIYRLTKKSESMFDTPDGLVMKAAFAEVIDALGAFKIELRESIQFWTEAYRESLVDGDITKKLPYTRADKAIKKYVYMNAKVLWGIWRENHPKVGKCIGKYCS